ncbi:MAG: hypothetical protein JOY80_04365, partial [Candidatus Dormibacteraeota bacterium]|nr:hypothetical protein [Candidatus Dormibacteraeota bacterium]
ALGTSNEGPIELAVTASKVTLGYMNEIARYFKYGIAMEGGLEAANVDELNRGARRELHLTRTPPGYFVPIELADARGSSMALFTRPGGRSTAST